MRGARSTLIGIAACVATALAILDNAAPGGTGPSA
jgi:hypothetical protein